MAEVMEKKVSAVAIGKSLFNGMIELQRLFRVQGDDRPSKNRSGFAFHRFEVLDKLPGLFRVIRSQIASPPVTDRLIEQLNRDLERTSCRARVDSIQHIVAPIRERRIFARIAVYGDIGSRCGLVEAPRQKAIVLEVAYG